MAVQARVSRVVTCVCKVLCSDPSASLLELSHLVDLVLDGVETSPAGRLPHVLRSPKKSSRKLRACAPFPNASDCSPTERKTL